ncbi:MAG: zf-TFIIB domain-containing protein [Victivallales bacterium]|nr:zf-TFIIB domain-containing protein [Victivallales bacterium]
MLVIELRDVEVDFCSECRGVWLDEGELDLLLPKNSKNGSAIAAELESTTSPKGKGGRECPVCGKRMLLVDIPIDSDVSETVSSVEVDKCPRNHGLWFDKGELQTIASSAKGEPVSDFLGDMFAADA